MINWWNDFNLKQSWKLILTTHHNNQSWLSEKKRPKFWGRVLLTGRQYLQFWNHIAISNILALKNDGYFLIGRIFRTRVFSWENGEIMIKRRGNGKRMRKWRENKEMERDYISSISLYFFPLYPFPTRCFFTGLPKKRLSARLLGNSDTENLFDGIYYLIWHLKLLGADQPKTNLYIKNCLILSQNVNYGTFVANVTKKTYHTRYEKKILGPIRCEKAPQVVSASPEVRNGYGYGYGYDCGLWHHAPLESVQWPSTIRFSTNGKRSNV